MADFTDDEEEFQPSGDEEEEEAYVPDAGSEDDFEPGVSIIFGF